MFGFHVFYESSLISPEFNSISLMLKETFYFWTPLIYLAFDTRFRKFDFIKKKRRKMQLSRSVQFDVEKGLKLFNQRL